MSCTLSFDARARAWAEFLYFCAFHEDPDEISRLPTYACEEGQRFRAHGEFGYIDGCVSAVQNSSDRLQEWGLVQAMDHAAAHLGLRRAHLLPRLEGACAPLVGSLGVFVASGSLGRLAIGVDELSEGPPDWHAPMGVTIALRAPLKEGLVIALPMLDLQEVPSKGVGGSLSGECWSSRANFYGAAGLIYASVETAEEALGALAIRALGGAEGDGCPGEFRPGSGVLVQRAMGYAASQWSLNFRAKRVGLDWVRRGDERQLIACLQPLSVPLARCTRRDDEPVEGRWVQSRGRVGALFEREIEGKARENSP